MSGEHGVVVSGVVCVETSLALGEMLRGFANAHVEPFCALKSLPDHGKWLWWRLAMAHGSHEASQ